MASVLLNQGLQHPKDENGQKDTRMALCLLHQRLIYGLYKLGTTCSTHELRVGTQLQSETVIVTCFLKKQTEIKRSTTTTKSFWQSMTSRTSVSYPKFFTPPQIFLFLFFFFLVTLSEGNFDQQRTLKSLMK